MTKTSLFCLATSRTQADEIVDHLRMANFSKNDISALFPDKASTRDFAHDTNTKAPEGAVAGARMGGALAWIAGFGALPIPGVGPFIAAGPIIAAFSGTVGGGIAGALIALGIPHLEARHYESKIKEGHILISVHTEDVGDIARARDIFKQAGAQHISVAGEASTSRYSQATERGPRPFEVSAA